MKIPLLFTIFLLLWAGACLDASSLPSGCDMCHWVIGTFQKQFPKNPTLPILQDIAYEYCVKKHLQDNNVCKGAIKQMTRYIIAGLWRHWTNPHLICQDVRICSKEYIKRNLQTDIQQTIKNKPQKVWEQATSKRILKILHISDLHPDLFYSEGAPAECTEPVCCRANVTAKTNSTKKAGYWGSLADCDLPIQTFDLFLQQVKKMDADAIIWTGDNTPHDIWQQTQSYNVNFTTLLALKIQQQLNITVIPAMGNHQSWPVNVYDHHSDRQDALNEGLAQAWRPWLSAQAFKMQRTKGYYSMVYPKFNNLKVLSLNTQAGNDENWLLLQDPSDPGDQLAWIQKQLTESQKNNQIVFIIGHIPPNDNLNDWSMRYNALVDRYSYIIRGQFYGHTHGDHFAFFPAMKGLTNTSVTTAQVTNYYLVSGSLTTYSGRVPQYRVMDIDYDTLQIVDYTQYRFDLRKYTKKSDNAGFQILYRFKQAFKLADMRPESGITQLRNKMRDEPETRKMYDQHKCAGICDGSNDKGIFCDTMSSPQFIDECNGKKFKKSGFEKAAGPWRKWTHQ